MSEKRNPETNRPKFQNKVLETYECIESDCHNVITFTERDKEFYVQKGFVDAKGNVTKPRRCKSCKLKRQANQGSSPTNSRY